MEMSIKVQSKFTQNESTPPIKSYIFNFLLKNRADKTSRKFISPIGFVFNREMGRNLRFTPHLSIKQGTNASAFLLP